MPSVENPPPSTPSQQPPDHQSRLVRARAVVTAHHGQYLDVLDRWQMLEIHPLIDTVLYYSGQAWLTCTTGANLDRGDHNEVFGDPSYLDKFIIAWMDAIPEGVVASIRGTKGCAEHWRCDINTNTGFFMMPVEYPEALVDHSKIDKQLESRRLNAKSPCFLMARSIPCLCSWLRMSDPTRRQTISRMATSVGNVHVYSSPTTAGKHYNVVFVVQPYRVTHMCI
ncbi:uncharacterized protein B0T15DRAFT_558827 [Chaetomium strumarium]|uniref:Uncharacterized protein n=1 Tax=Chaetomium strumarium TaxID=1170767 RepID=A0AAJ0GRH2_9PEZI|nr:hypothetical protein B0T15DRAFT_558827 [Chaetomium strumarium]